MIEPQNSKCKNSAAFPLEVTSTIPVQTSPLRCFFFVLSSRLELSDRAMKSPQGRPKKSPARFRVVQFGAVMFTSRQAEGQEVLDSEPQSLHAECLLDLPQESPGCLLPVEDDVAVDPRLAVGCRADSPVVRAANENARHDPGDRGFPKVGVVEVFPGFQGRRWCTRHRPSPRCRLEKTRHISFPSPPHLRSRQHAAPKSGRVVGDHPATVLIRLK